MLHFLVEHTLTEYVEFIKKVSIENLHRFRRNRSRMIQNISFQTAFLNRQTKLRAIFFVNAYFWRSD